MVADDEDGAAFRARLTARAREVETALDALLPAPSGEPADRLFEAMRYAALGGGKRLRGFLVLEAGALCGASEPGARRVAAAIECVHAYSLAHDDLPCMDDDDLRRGRPTTHIAFDEATAVLAGDALQTLAFEILAAPETCPSPAARAALVTLFARASGAHGMVGGQSHDLAMESRPPGARASLDEIAQLQARKTGALIRAAAVSGAVLAEAGADAEAALGAYADALGLAFQIRDDLLDVEGDEQEAGKRLRKDADAGKATFVALLGVDGARAQAEALIGEAETALAPFGAAAKALNAAARFALQRQM